MIRTWGYGTVGEVGGRQCRSAVGVFQYVDNTFVVMVRPHATAPLEVARLVASVVQRSLYEELSNLDASKEHQDLLQYLLSLLPLEQIFQLLIL